jgi:ribonuclease BN (tRNA processing enzyme)
MFIKILGTRGRIEHSAPYHSRHSGVLIDNKILFDLGESEFLNYELKAIFLTHLHPDHAFFMLSEYKDVKIGINRIYAPEKYENNQSIKVINNIKKINSFKITPIETYHSKKVKSQGYLIEEKNQKIFYTGDMIWINKKYHELLQNSNLVITEASFFRRGGLVRRDKKTGEIYGHTGVPDLVNLFKRFTKNILLIHYGSWFYRNISKARKEIKKLARESKVNIITGYDGLKIDTNEL